MKRAREAVRAGAVLPLSSEDDPVWVIGAINYFNWFIQDVRRRVWIQRYGCLYCVYECKKWDDMVKHLSKPKEKAAHAKVAWSECVAHADEQRERHIK